MLHYINFFICCLTHMEHRTVTINRKVVVQNHLDG